MGEIAEMMLDGTLCEACGEYIGGARGFPRYCSTACEELSGNWSKPKSRKQRFEARHVVPDRGERVEHKPTTDFQQTHKPWRCLDCGRRFRLEQAVRDHWRQTHTSKLEA